MMVVLGSEFAVRVPEFDRHRPRFVRRRTAASHGRTVWMVVGGRWIVVVVPGLRTKNEEQPLSTNHHPRSLLLPIYMARELLLLMDHRRALGPSALGSRAL